MIIDFFYVYFVDIFYIVVILLMSLNFYNIFEQLFYFMCFFGCYVNSS